MELTLNTTHSESLTVTDAQTAQTMGSGCLPVLATPALVALMEQAAWKCVQPMLDAGCGTVGTRMELEHLAATPLGMEVTAHATLTAVEGRKLTFAVTAEDAAGPIGRGVHERFIVQNEKFLSKANAKAGK